MSLRSQCLLLYRPSALAPGPDCHKRGRPVNTPHYDNVVSSYLGQSLVVPSVLASMASTVVTATALAVVIESSVLESALPLLVSVSLFLTQERLLLGVVHDLWVSIN